MIIKTFSDYPNFLVLIFPLTPSFAIHPLHLRIIYDTLNSHSIISTLATITYYSFISQAQGSDNISMELPVSQLY